MGECSSSFNGPVIHDFEPSPGRVEMVQLARPGSVRGVWGEELGVEGGGHTVKTVVVGEEDVVFNRKVNG